MKVYREKFDPEIAIRASLADYIEQDGLINYPPYAIEEIAYFQQREELIRLRARLEAAEQVRLSGAPTDSLAQVFDEV